MDFDLRELTLIKHFEQLLLTIPNPKRRIVVVNDLLEISWNALVLAKREKSRLAYEKRRAKEEKCKPEMQLLNKLSLNVGDIVRLSGTRDSGMREVIGIEGTRVVCYQLTGQSNIPWVRCQPTLKSHRRTGIKTKNDLSKITHVAEDGKWKDLREEYGFEHRKELE